MRLAFGGQITNRLHRLSWLRVFRLAQNHRCHRSDVLVVLSGGRRDGRMGGTKDFCGHVVWRGSMLFVWCNDQELPIAAVKLPAIRIFETEVGTRRQHFGAK